MNKSTKTESFKAQGYNESSHEFFVVATPIGNLKDITFRAVETLKECNLILAEDCRVTLKLLNHLQIKKPLISYNKLNEREVANNLETLFNKYDRIALVTDAGTPAISDPGAEVVKRAYELNAKVIPVAGASALTAAASASGFTEKDFAFLQFLPRKKSEQTGKLKQVAASSLKMCVFYESPNRIIETLKNIADLCTEIAVFNDITKLHERVYRGAPEEVIDTLAGNENANKGEYTVAILLKELAENAEEEYCLEAKIVNEMHKTLCDKKTAIKNLSAKGENKNDLYKASLNLK